MQFFTVRSTNLYAFLVCVSLITASYYFQYGLLLEPCPLCIIQRLFIILLAFLFLLGTGIKTKVITRIHCTITALIAGLGAASAARKLWIQHGFLDEPLLSCKRISVLLKDMPLSKLWQLLLQGEETCANITWHFLGLSMSGWTLIFFLLFITLAWVNFYRA